jgi:hypothetical protein
VSQNIGNERVYLKQCELADRWLISERTLEGCRMRGRGPRVTKIGKRVRYSMVEILAFEKAHLESADRYV